MHHISTNGQEKGELKLPSIFELFGYKIYFWANENEEPIHVHISKSKPVQNSQKYGLLKGEVVF